MNCFAAILVLLVASAAGEDVMCRKCQGLVLVSDDSTVMGAMNPVFEGIMEASDAYIVCPGAAEVTCGAGEECVSMRLSGDKEVAGLEYSLNIDKAACAAPETLTCETFESDFGVVLTGYENIQCVLDADVWAASSSASTSAPIALLLLSVAYLAMFM